MKRLTIACLALLPAILLADAAIGEFFGYKIGGRYPLTKSTRGRLNWTGDLWHLAAESPKKPEKMGEVTVTTTLRTQTIVSISSSTEFKSYEEARTFAIQFSEILKAQYKFEKWENLLGDSILGTFLAKNSLTNSSITANLNKDYRITIFLGEA
jgi:hypothetical protein